MWLCIEVEDAEEARVLSEHIKAIELGDWCGRIMQIADRSFVILQDIE